MPFTQNINPTFPKQPQNSKVQITNGTNLANVTIVTPGANGSKVVGLLASSTDTSGRDIQVKVTNGGTDYILGTKTVAAGSGNAAGTPAVNLLDPTVIVGLPVDSDGNPFIFLGSSDTLTAATLVQLTSTKVVNLTAIYSDF